MKPKIGYFFWILMLAFALMILIVAAQELTRQNIKGLKKGNKEAVKTFNINNSLSNLVNLSFELEKKITDPINEFTTSQPLTDSLAMLGYHASLLEEMSVNEDVDNGLKKLSNLISRQVETSIVIVQTKGIAVRKSIADLKRLHISDSVFSTALSIQKSLEKELQDTLDNNEIASTQLTAYNRTLAIIAIAAILILCTIIINRHLRQVQLISELETATAAAKQSAMIKEQFLANMSHEIRTPLNAIKGFSRLISQTTLNPEQKQYVTIINNSSDSLVYIVNDILDISKIEAGKLRIEVKDFELNKILQTVEYMFVNAATEKRLQYFQYIDSNIPLRLKGDPERLSQILINLINNGIKFTTEGYVKTIVTLQKEENNTVWIEFKLEDSGIGIPADKLDTIFQRFQQLRTNKENLTQGTGLGLSIVKNLATLMGGYISVSSEYGKGSVFKVILPFEKVIFPGAVNDEMMTLPVYTNKYEGNVLIVEDNKVNQLLLKNILSGFGIATEIVFNGQEALDIITQDKFDLVLLDIQMPVMDGYATIEALRKQKTITTPVVAMTAYATMGEREKCLLAGMNDYITKPVDFAQLIKILDFFLDTQKKSLRQKTFSETVPNDFLLQLAGGDKIIAQSILQEIKTEIPKTIQRLSNISKSKDFSQLRSICHHMVSTFSPMGNETIVMRKINQIGEIDISSHNNKVMFVEELLKDLQLFETELDEKILQLNLSYNPSK